MITLKSYEDEDLRELKNVYNTVFNNNELIPKYQTAEKFEEVLIAEKIYCTRSLLAYDDDGDGKIVGFILVSIKNKMAHIFSIGVIDEYRRIGIGKRLLNRLVRDLVEIEEIAKISIEINVNDKVSLSLLENYGFVKSRKLHTLYRVCPERDIIKSKYDITTEFPSEILKSHKIYHQVDQPWNRSFEYLSQYTQKVIGYSVLLKGRMLGYVLVGFDNTILDMASKVSVEKEYGHMFSLLYHLFAKFDNLVTIDLPEDDELFDIYIKTNFETAYKKYELLLSIKPVDE